MSEPAPFRPPDAPGTALPPDAPGAMPPPGAPAAETAMGPFGAPPAAPGSELNPTEMPDPLGLEPDATGAGLASEPPEPPFVPPPDYTPPPPPPLPASSWPPPGSSRSYDPADDPDLADPASGAPAYSAPPDPYSGVRYGYGAPASTYGPSYPYSAPPAPRYGAPPSIPAPTAYPAAVLTPMPAAVVPVAPAPAPGPAMAPPGPGMAPPPPAGVMAPPSPAVAPPPPPGVMAPPSPAVAPPPPPGVMAPPPPVLPPGAPTRAAAVAGRFGAPGGPGGHGGSGGPGGHGGPGAPGAHGAPGGPGGPGGPEAHGAGGHGGVPHAAAGAAHAAKDSFWRGFVQGGVVDTGRGLSFLPRALWRALKPGSGAPKTTERGRARWGQLFTSMAISAGAGGAVRAGLGAVVTGGFNLLIRAGAGMVSTAAVGLYKGEFKRREGEGRRERAGRVVGSIMVRGSVMGLVGGVFAPYIAEGVHHAAGWVSDVAGSLSDHYQAEGIPSPEAPIPVPEVPQEITTSPLGEFTGGYDPQTHFYGGTGYNSIAKALMDNYQANTGQTLDWHTLHNHIYHTEMVQQVLESNNIGDGYDSVWEGAKHMSDGATLTIEPSQIQHFVDQLNASTGQHFDAKDFMRFGPDDAAPVGAEGVSVEGLSPDVVQETGVELSNYLEGPGRGFLEAIVNGTLTPGSSEFESFQHGFAEYLSAHDSHLSAELLTQAVRHPGTVGELFQGLLAEHAVAPHFETYMGANPIDPNVSVNDYVAIFEGSSSTYYGLPDSLKAVIHQQLLQQAQEHFNLVGANN